MLRLLYTLRKAYHHRYELRKIKHQGIATLRELSLPSLLQQGFQALLLDFDGVLANYGAKQPCTSLLPWLTQACELFGEQRVFILTNKPNQTRANYFQQHFPAIKFIQGFPKKPYPHATAHILSLTQLPPEACLLIDDRLLTGGLLACITGIAIQYITNPFINYKKHPLQERCFQFLRHLERYWFH